MWMASSNERWPKIGTFRPLADHCIDNVYHPYVLHRDISIHNLTLQLVPSGGLPFVSYIYKYIPGLISVLALFATLPLELLIVTLASPAFPPS